jgi:carbonic anhydrase
LADHDFRRSYADKVGASEAELASMAVLDPAATVADDVARLLSAPPIPSTVSVSGHVYDVDTGLVTTVVETTAVGS